MATTVDTLLIEIKGETKNLRKGLKDVNKNLDGTNNKLAKLKAAFGGLRGIVAAVLGGAAVGSVINTIRTFEDLEATLRAVTGSSEAAATSFKLIRAFTAQTTFQIDEVARSFITLKQAGITPTSDALMDFGNFAAGMGKSITQLAQAAFNATTGEMEMLKQFGVVARQQGDQITVTFDGQTKVIERSGESIVEFLRSIGRENFSTAIEERFKTLSGSISNLKDQVSEFSVAFGEGISGGDENEGMGFRQSLAKLSRTIAGLLENLRPLANFFGAIAGFILEVVNMVFALIDGLALLARIIANPIESFKNFEKQIEENTFSFQTFRSEVIGTGDSIEKLDAEIEEFLAKNPDVANGTEKMADGMKQLKQAVIESSMAFTKQFSDALLNAENSLKSFRDFAKNIVSQIVTIFLQMEVVNRILAQVFPKMGISYGGIFTDAGTGSPDAAAPTPEGVNINFPDITDSTTSNAVGTQASGVQVVQNINFATGINATVRNEVIQLMPQIAEVTRAAVQESAQRSPRYRSAFSA